MIYKSCPFCGFIPMPIAPGVFQHPVRHDWLNCPLNGILFKVDEWQNRYPPVPHISIINVGEPQSC